MRRHRDHRLQHRDVCEAIGRRVHPHGYALCEREHGYRVAAVKVGDHGNTLVEPKHRNPSSLLFHPSRTPDLLQVLEVCNVVTKERVNFEKVVYFLS